MNDNEQRAAVGRVRAYLAAYPTLWTIDGGEPPPVDRPIHVVRHYADPVSLERHAIRELTYADLQAVLARLDALEPCRKALKFDNEDAAQSFAALCRRKAVVAMFASACGDHWHVWGVA